MLSSQVAGTQATLVDLLTFEADIDAVEPDADLEEVGNYPDALEFARDPLADPQGLPP